MSLRIKDWHKHYEMGDFKKTRHARWYPKSTRQDGKSYKRLLRMPDGHLHYLAFTLMEQIAAKAPERGTLADDNGDLTPDDMALITEAPSEIFANSIKPLILIGWLEGEPPIGNSPTDSESPGKFPPRRQDKEDKTGQDKEDKLPPPKRPGAGTEQKKAAPTVNSSAWGVWIDTHRAAGKADPLKAPEDLGAAKRLALLIPGVDELSKLMALYLADPDPYLVRNSHCLRYMAQRVGNYRDTKQPDTPVVITQEVKDFVIGKGQPP